MKKILLIDKNKSKLNNLFQLLKKDYIVKFDTDIVRHLEEINLDSSLLVFLGVYAKEDVIPLLKKHQTILDKKVILIDHGKPAEYFMQCFKYGALNKIKWEAIEYRVTSLLNLYRNISQEFNQAKNENLDVKYESKKLVLQNKDVYDSDQVHVVIEYLLQSTRPMMHYDSYIGLVNSLYEVLFNAMEHGNLGIGTEEKEKLLLENKYNSFLEEQLKKNSLKIFVQSEIDQEQFFLKIKDQGMGFDCDKDFCKGERLSGRGILIAKHFFDEVNFLSAGRECALKKNLARKI